MIPLTTAQKLATNLVEATRSAARTGSTVAQRRVFQAAMALPEPLQRRIVGDPVVLDGVPLATDTQLMLLLQKALRQPPVETLDFPQARRALLAQCQLIGGRQRVGSVREVTAAGLRARLYIPSGSRGRDPLLVFLHGGGFVYGDLDSHDAPCRALAEQAGVRVLSVDYRLAPEHPFPAAYDDSLAAFEWALAHADELGADPGRIGVGGDSAGGNLAAGVALAVTDRCAFQLLVYPVTTTTHETESARLFDTGFFLTGEFIRVASDGYLPPSIDRGDPRLQLLDAEVPAGVAPAYVCTAGFDPLRDEGEAYAERLRDHGVKVELKRFGDQIHGFFNGCGAGRSSQAAFAEIAAAVKAGLRS